ncbi:hypothetical protein U1Q18_021557, partial [Sarracenia purpurea var. burkii]
MADQYRRQLDAHSPEAVSVLQDEKRGTLDKSDAFNRKEVTHSRKTRNGTVSASKLGEENGVVIAPKLGEEKVITDLRDWSQHIVKIGGDPRESSCPNRMGEDEPAHDPLLTRSNRYPPIQDPSQPIPIIQSAKLSQPSILTQPANHPQPNCLTQIENQPKPIFQTQPFYHNQPNSIASIKNLPQSHTQTSVDNPPQPSSKYPKPTQSSPKSEHTLLPLVIEPAENPGEEATYSKIEDMAGTESSSIGELELGFRPVLVELEEWFNSYLILKDFWFFAAAAEPLLGLFGEEGVFDGNSISISTRPILIQLSLYGCLLVVDGYCSADNVHLRAVHLKVLLLSKRMGLFLKAKRIGSIIGLFMDGYWAIWHNWNLGSPFSAGRPKTWLGDIHMFFEHLCNRDVYCFAIDLQAHGFHLIRDALGSGYAELG